MAQNAPLPPWLAFPDLPPGDIRWRMGEAEDYLRQLAKWLTKLEPAERRSYLLSHEVIPNAWLLWATEWYAFPEDNDLALDQAWAILTNRKTGQP